MREMSHACRNLVGKSLREDILGTWACMGDNIEVDFGDIQGEGVNLFTFQGGAHRCVSVKTVTNSFFHVSCYVGEIYI